MGGASRSLNARPRCKTTGLGALRAGLQERARARSPVVPAWNRFGCAVTRIAPSPLLQDRNCVALGHRPARPRSGFQPGEGGSGTWTSEERRLGPIRQGRSVPLALGPPGYCPWNLEAVGKDPIRAAGPVLVHHSGLVGASNGGRCACPHRGAPGGVAGRHKAGAKRPSSVPNDAKPEPASRQERTPHAQSPPGPQRVRGAVESHFGWKCVGASPVAEALISPLRRLFVTLCFISMDRRAEVHRDETLPARSHSASQRSSRSHPVCGPRFVLSRPG